MVGNLLELDFNRGEIILLFLIPACINLGIFIYASFVLPGNRTNFAFSIFVLLLALWQVADGLVRLSQTAEVAQEWFRMAWAFSLFAIPFAILFILYNSPNKWKVSTRDIFMTQFFPSIVFMIMLLARLDSFNMEASRTWYWISNPHPTFITSLIYFWTSLQALFMLGLLWANYYEERKDPVAGQQKLLMAVGFTIPILGGIIAKTILPFFLGLNVVPITTSLFTVFSIFTLIAIKKYRLLDYSPREQWDRIVEAMSEGLLIVNNQDEIMYANERFCSLLGYEFNEIKGKVAKDLFLADEKSRDFMDRMNEERQLRKSSHYELQLKAKSGELIWVSMSGSPYLDNQGNVIGSIGIQTDINTLKKAETRFRTLIENAGDIIAMTDKDGQVIYASPSLERITGYTMDEMRGRPSFMIMHPDQVEDAKRVLQELLNNPGVPIPRNNRFLHKNGHYVWLEGTVINLLEDPNVQAIVSNYRDITEKKKTEEKLAQNMNWFKTMVEYGNDAIAVIDETDTVKYLSPNNERILGYSLDELYQRDREAIHPDDRALMKEVTMEAIAAPGKTLYLQFRRRHKNGKWIWLEAHVTNFLNDANIKGLVVNYRDVTERKVAEEKLKRSESIYKTIASSITGSVIIMVDTDYTYLLIEGDMLEKFGYTKQGLLGFRAPDVIPPDRFKTVEKELKRVFEGEVFMTESSRNGFDILTRYVPLFDEHKQVYAALIVTIDVSQIKQNQREIAELNRNLEAKVAERTSQLEIANKELESFTYSVSHDLRAPLRAIHGYTQILQGEYIVHLDDEGKRLMNRVLVNTKKMGQLIDELLTFSRLGKKEISKHSFSMKDLVTSIANEMKAAEGKRDIVIHLAELPDVQADSVTIKQVWINLLSNAIKYTRLKAKAEIAVGAIDNGETVTYFIRDNGAGFDMNYMDKLFGVFQRLHSEEEFEGIGVGLAIVQRIILKHGGKVWAEGKEGEGATFYFQLKKTKD